MAATPQTQATQTTWKIDPSHSTIEFSAKHMMFTTVKGRFTGVQGTIVADEANPARSSVAVTIDAASLDSRDERRDGHLRGADFLDVDTYPHITFETTRVESMAPQSEGDADPEANMPRWRRPSLLEARRSDPTRYAPSYRTPMRFGPRHTKKLSMQARLRSLALPTGKVAQPLGRLPIHRPGHLRRQGTT